MTDPTGALGPDDVDQADDGDEVPAVDPGDAELADDPRTGDEPA